MPMSLEMRSHDGLKSDTLCSFRDFAESSVSSNQAAGVSDYCGQINITGATKTACSLARKIKFSTAGQEAAKNNNRVRDLLVGALKDQFEAKTFEELPASVKAALVGRYARTAAEDFGFDDQGRSQSGKPLTKRRIAAVMRAVAAEVAKADGAAQKTRAFVSPKQQAAAVSILPLPRITKVLEFVNGKLLTSISEGKAKLTAKVSIRRILEDAIKRNTPIDLSSIKKILKDSADAKSLDASFEELKKVLDENDVPFKN